jgi:hypothetical protein
MSDFGELRADLDRLGYGLWHDCEHGDAALDGLNDRLRRLAATGLLGPTVVLGPVVLARPYAVGGPTISGQVVQAVLALPHGFGAVYWDTEDWVAHGDDASREVSALRAVTPFEECEPAVRALIAPHAGRLLRTLLGQIET